MLVLDGVAVVSSFVGGVVVVCESEAHRKWPPRGGRRSGGGSGVAGDGGCSRME